jgi:hypothetical protein
LFHESLHQQLYDFRRGHSLLDPAFGRADAPLIHSPWNRPDPTNGNYWDVHRALAAFHVYVHLALLSTVAEQRASSLEVSYGPIKMVGSRTALARAHYLGEQLRTLCWQELGPAGHQVVDWFSSILEILDPSPPAPGACIHLLFDRYWREAREVGNIPTTDQRSDLPELLRTLTGHEVESARNVLTTMNEDQERFNRAFGAFSQDDPVTQFVSTRLLVAETIMNLSPGTYKLSNAADDIVREMVEDSSDALMPILDGNRGDMNKAQPAASKS